MPKPETIRVSPREQGQTLAAVLRARVPELSWSEARQLIRTRHIMIDGNMSLDAGRRLKGDEVIKLLEHPAAPPPREDDVRVRFVDEHLVVVEKPAGMTSVRHAEERSWHERRKQLQPTLEDVLPRILVKRAKTPLRQAQDKRRGRLPPRSIKGAGRRGLANRDRGHQPTPVPVRPVHRLDRDTSGLMVFARTVPAERHLGQQFRSHTTHRRYLAVVHGDVQAQTIETRLIRDRGDGRRGSTPSPDLGKPAVTHIQPLEQLGGYTLIECRLETGRTHQIRIHLAELGHPVCGETVYHRPRFGSALRDTSGAPRLALHATELGFMHPTLGERMDFSMPLPDDLQAFVDRLRARAR